MQIAKQAILPIYSITQVVINMDKVLVIVGPTGVGKSSYAVECAKKYNGEIISGDSIQVYKGLNIGSAKIKESEKQGIPHYLIDIKEPTDNYSVKEFQDLARIKIKEIQSRNKLPIICGGTGLYIKAILYDYEFFEEDRKDDQFDNLTNEEIYKQIETIDPESLKNIHINNRKRLVRALNIIKKHNTNITEIKNNQEHKLLYDAKIIGLTKPKEIINEIVDKRVDEMIEEGLLEEISTLLSNGLSFENQSMQGIGYKEFKDFFSKIKTKEECINDVKIHTHQFIKRQYTWFNNQMNVEWYDNKEDATCSINKWYE